MITSLFRYSKDDRSSQNLESVTDDAHTRSLLFGPSTHFLNLVGSPPPSPFGSPSQRPMSFDDQAGIEVEERDIRVILAQDACGGDDRPSVLFDSRTSAEIGGDGLSKRGHGSSGPPPSSVWRVPQISAQERAADGFRNRSSTFSSGQSSWAKTNRSLNSKDEPFLECMFGVPSSTKSASSTKMHIIPATSRQNTSSDRVRVRQSAYGEGQRRTNLSRAMTSETQAFTPRVEYNERDSLLITRLFHVALNEEARVADARRPTSVTAQEDVTITPQFEGDPNLSWKPPKLVERKVPAFAVGVIIQLPSHVQRPRSPLGRPSLSFSLNQSVTSASSSYGSDLQSSWTFLDAIPASLSSSQTLSDDGDRRVDQIVCNWDVITRSISSVESIAADLIQQQLQVVVKQMAAPQEKAPKEKSMQRINQRMVFVHDASVIASNASLNTSALGLCRRIAYAVRIPRVITGLGFTSGHWIDEARMLYRKCGGKQQQFFLFNLMTAFLGNHTQWLEKLAPEWYRKQFHAAHRKLHEVKTLASRTVIISEQKSLARRLIYMLASFLPGRGGIDVLRKLGEDDLSSFLMSSSSPLKYHTNLPSSGTLARNVDQRRASSRLAGGTALSTSASSYNSQTSALAIQRSRGASARRDLNKIQIQSGGIFALPQNENMPNRSSAGTTSTIVPDAPATPVAYISNLRDSYFPETAIAESSDSIASVDLAKVLHKANSAHRRSSSVSSRWGSFVSGISEMLSNKPVTPVGDRGSVTTASQSTSPLLQHRRSVTSNISRGKSNPLQMMVDELDSTGDGQNPKRVSTTLDSALSPERQSIRTLSSAPRLFVDDKDGVIDVELDLPGFMGFSGPTPPKHLQSENTKVKGMQSANRKEGTHRNIQALVNRNHGVEDDEPINVGGYLRRHHEDFILHAVRPYSDLMSDITNSMKVEPTPQELKDQVLQDDISSTWVDVCTTLVADTKTFSIRRLTLRRQYEVLATETVECQDTVHLTDAHIPHTATRLHLKGEEITDELVMDFDTTLADAIEKALNVVGSETHGVTSIATSTNVSRVHSRNASGSASLNTKAIPTRAGGGVSSDHRDLVVGALEDVVKSVNDDLNRPGIERSTGIAQEHTGKDKPKPENPLREGVKRWMLNVEQSSTAVW